MALSSSYDNKFQGAQGTFNLDAGRFELVTGVDFLHYDLDQTQPAPVVTLARQNYTNGKYTNIGAFAIGKAHLLEERNLVLSAGLRYDTFKSDIKTLRDFSGGTPGIRKDVSTTQRKFLPSLGVTYHPLDYLKLRANYGHAFKMPSPREQGGVFNMGNTVFAGDPDIKPEQSKTWDIGIDVDYRALKLYATYFDTHYKDKIVALSAISIPGIGNARPYVNLNKVYLRGVEMGGAFDLGRHFNWGSNFEPYFALTRMTKYEDGTGEKLPDIAKMNASFGLRFHQPVEKLSANLDFVYYGKTLGYTGRIETNNRIKYETGGRTIANLRLVKSIAGFGTAGDLKLKVAVNNLFNKYYRSGGGGDPADNTYLPGRSFYVGLVYDLK
jgi:vitamin B12 transporter